MIYGTTGLQGVVLVRMNRCFDKIAIIYKQILTITFSSLGAVLAGKHGAHAALMGCAGFAAFSLAIESLMSKH